MRKALGKEKREPDPRYELLGQSLAVLEQRAASVRARLQQSAPDLAERLAKVAGARGWKVHLASHPQEVVQHICALSVALDARLVVRSDQPIFQRTPVDTDLRGLGIEVATIARSAGQSQDQMRDLVARADIGITGADHAIAETGTVVLLAARGISRLVSLAPPVHVAIVSAEQVVDSLDDLFLLRRLAYHQGNSDMGSYMNFITGPSRTADIEQTLVVGVHGPREAHLVVMR